MKLSYLFYVLVVLFNSVAYSQNVVEQFKEFYLKSDFDCYIDLYQRECELFYKEDAEQFKENCWFCQFNKENMIFILNVQFANTESYNYGDNIYNYLVVDSVRPFSVVFVDKRMNVLGIWGLHDRPYLENMKQKRDKERRKEITNINKEKPELILHFPNIMVRGYTPFFYYIKDGKIYVSYTRYVSFKHDLYFPWRSQELNEYFHPSNISDSMISHSKLTYIRQLNKIERYNDPQNIDNYVIRYGGYTPPEEVRVCPPLID